MRRYLIETKSISKMVIIIIALASVLSISITCYILREVITRHDEEMIHVIASDVYDDIRQELMKPVMLSRTISNDIFLQQNLQTELTRSESEETYIMTNYLKMIRDRLNCTSVFLVSDASKNYWHATGFIKRLDLENDPHDVWYKYTASQNADYLLHVDTDEANKMNLEVFVNAKIKDSDGNLLGICGVGIGMEVLQKLIAEDEQHYNIKINLVNRNGVVQVDTDASKIEKVNFESILSYQPDNPFIIKKIKDGYIITRYIPAFDWYLVIQREGNEMQSAFSNVILYMTVGFVIALTILLTFIHESLRKEQKAIETSAKKHGIASHAGLYVSMHLIDLKNNYIYELSKNPEFQLFILYDGERAEEKLKHAVKEMTVDDELDIMLEFVDFKTLPNRMKDKNVIYREFLIKQYGWCKAYFMTGELDKKTGVSETVFAIELIDEEKQREHQLQYLSETDAMTKLRNRGSGEKAITDLIANGKQGMFCMMDADKFKSINDNYGHDVGDKVIIAIADCLKKTFRNSDIVMRLGGDEFATYAIGITDEEHGRIVINRLFGFIDKIDIPELGDRKINISLGAAFFKADDKMSFAELYKRADSVTYESKKVEGNCATFFKESNLD
ncbi:MAG: GGDEF domain-containing protein [Selenomonadaceae bacterium]|nr:GGDEF domain-containing protein [Selenomonadaceae bacterium]